MLNRRGARHYCAAVGNGVAAPPQAARDTGGGGVDCQPRCSMTALRRLAELDPTGANRTCSSGCSGLEGVALRLLPRCRSFRSANYRAYATSSTHAEIVIGEHRCRQVVATVCEIESMIRLDTRDGLAERIDCMDPETTAVLQTLKQMRGVAREV